jgi:hypothetical protein
VSVYFDAMDAPSPSPAAALRNLYLDRPPGAASSSGGSVAGASPGASPRALRGGSGSSGGGADIHLPHYTPTSQHHAHQEGTLAAVPSGDLEPAERRGRRGPAQPGCRCVVS